MTYLELQVKIKQNLFTLADVEKYFPQELAQTLRMQLTRFAKRKLIKQIKRGMYVFDSGKIDELELANLLYQPSYISLESALNYYGLIPDVPQAITSVNPTTSKKIVNDFGSFYYAKIKKELFFGFTQVVSPRSERLIRLAQKEKALLDYFYLRKLKQVEDLRLNLQTLDRRRYQQYVVSFPNWVQKIKLNT